MPDLANITSAEITSWTSGGMDWSSVDALRGKPIYPFAEALRKAIRERLSLYTGQSQYLRDFFSENYDIRMLDLYTYCARVDEAILYLFGSWYTDPSCVFMPETIPLDDQGWSEAKYVRLTLPDIGIAISDFNAMSARCNLFADWLFSRYSIVNQCRQVAWEWSSHNASSSFMTMEYNDGECHYNQGEAILWDASNWRRFYGNRSLDWCHCESQWSYMGLNPSSLNAVIWFSRVRALFNQAQFDFAAWTSMNVIYPEFKDLGNSLVRSAEVVGCYGRGFEVADGDGDGEWSGLAEVQSGIVPYSYDGSRDVWIVGDFNYPPPEPPGRGRLTPTEACSVWHLKDPWLQLAPHFSFSTQEGT